MEWLWRGRIPLGMLTMFAGDPKLGKSYFTLTLAAAEDRLERAAIMEYDGGLSREAAAFAVGILRESDRSS